MRAAPGTRLLAIAMFLAIGVRLGAQQNPSISLVGLVGADNTTKVRLVNATTGVAAWVAIGETFGGYRFASFDQRTGSAVLVRDTMQLRLQLRTPQVRSATATPAAVNAAAAAAAAAASSAPVGPVPVPMGAPPMPPAGGSAPAGAPAAAPAAASNTSAQAPADPATQPEPAAQAQ